MNSKLIAFILRYQRDWRFHKSDGNWLTRSQYGGVKEQTGSYEKGQYNVFDPLQWRKVIIIFGTVFLNCSSIGFLFTFEVVHSS